MLSISRFRKIALSLQAIYAIILQRDQVPLRRHKIRSKSLHGECLKIDKSQGSALRTGSDRYRQDHFDPLPCSQRPRYGALFQDLLSYGKDPDPSGCSQSRKRHEEQRAHHKVDAGRIKREHVSFHGRMRRQVLPPRKGLLYKA